MMQEINRVRMRHVKEEALLPAGAKVSPALVYTFKSPAGLIAVLPLLLLLLS